MLVFSESPRSGSCLSDFTLKSAMARSPGGDSENSGAAWETTPRSAVSSEIEAAEGNHCLHSHRESAKKGLALSC